MAYQASLHQRTHAAPIRGMPVESLDRSDSGADHFLDDSEDLVGVRLLIVLQVPVQKHVHRLCGEVTESGVLQVIERRVEGSQQPERSAGGQPGREHSPDFFPVCLARPLSGIQIVAQSTQQANLKPFGQVTLQERFPVRNENVRNVLLQLLPVRIRAAEALVVGHDRWHEVLDSQPAARS